MNTTNVIRITNPSKELVAFMKESIKNKRERMEEMRKSFLASQPQ